MPDLVKSKIMTFKRRPKHGSLLLISPMQLCVPPFTMLQAADLPASYRLCKPPAFPAPFSTLNLNRLCNSPSLLTPSSLPRSSCNLLELS